eukprot:6186849-Pleurochrysis_carterae.AAC.1
MHHSASWLQPFRPPVFRHLTLAAMTQASQLSPLQTTHSQCGVDRPSRFSLRLLDIPRSSYALEHSRSWRPHATDVSAPISIRPRSQCAPPPPLFPPIQTPNRPRLLCGRFSRASPRRCAGHRVQAAPVARGTRRHGR